jgi:hypothetical protein
MSKNLPLGDDSNAIWWSSRYFYRWF